MCKYGVMLMYMLICMCKKIYVHRKEKKGSKNVFKTVSLTNAQTGNSQMCSFVSTAGFSLTCSHFAFDPAAVWYAESLTAARSPPGDGAALLL